MKFKLVWLLVISAFLLPTVYPARADGPSRFTFADLGQKDISVKTTRDAAYVHFPLAEGRNVQRAVLKLHLAHGKNLMPTRSNLTIALNDEPVVSLMLTPENADSGVVDVALPTVALRPGDNVFSFQFNLRLLDTGCGDAGNLDLWAKILSDTAVEFDVSDAPIAPDLSRFPAPFSTLTTLGSSPQLAIVLPARPTSAELTAAAQIAAALGQAAGWQAPPISALTVDQLDSAYAADHLIVIDTAGRNPLAAGAQPGLTEQVSPRNSNRLMLIVSAANDIALLQAADMVSTQSARAYLQGVHIDARPVRPRPIPEQPAQATFAELGFSDRQVKGIGLHDVYYPIDVPYDWKVTSEAAIDLRFTHSHSLASSRSLMSAFINGIEVADAPLADRNADDGRLSIRLSPRQLRPGRNWLHLVFDLHVPREDCNLRYTGEAQARVSAASLLNLAPVKSELPLDLHYLPSPLLTPVDLSGDVFVLPELPTLADLTAMVRLAAKLGTFSNADGLRPRAMTADQFDAASLTRARVIAIGQLEANKVLTRYDAQLPQPLSRATGGTIQPAGGRELLPDEMSNKAGYVQIIPAPWSRHGVLFVVSAFDQASLLAVVDALPVMGQRLKIQGDVAVVSSGQATGLTLGQLAGISLSGSARVAVSRILIGGVVAIGSVGLVSARRRARLARQESKDEND